jgi:hypothetical protein
MSITQRAQNVTASTIILNALYLLRAVTAEHEAAPDSDFESFLQSLKKQGGNRKITHVGCDVYFRATSNKSLAVAVMDQRAWGPHFCPVYRVIVKGDHFLEVTSVNDPDVSVLMPMPYLGVMHSKLAAIAVKLGSAEFDKSGFDGVSRSVDAPRRSEKDMDDGFRQEPREKHPPTEYGSGRRSPLDAARTGRLMHFTIDSGRSVINHKVARHATRSSAESI